jgi:hypothetical protein
MTDPKNVICFKNAEEIANYIGESKNSITQLVAEEDLPAWKRHGTGPWRALNIDIDKWLVDRRNKFYHDKYETSVGAQANH